MRPFFRIVNIALLVSAVFFIALFIMLNYQKTTINALGDYAVHKYVKYHKKQSKKAIKQLRKDDISGAVELLGDWSEIDKGDRIYPLKRSMLITLSKWLYKNRQFEELLYWAESWRSLDDRDVDAMAYWAEAIKNTPERHDEGLEALARQWRKFPNNKTLSAFYKDAIGDEKFNEYRLEVNPTTINGRSSTWHVFWDTGSGFNKKDTAAVQLSKQKDIWTISGKLPVNILRLRFDPPSTTKIKLSQIKLNIDGIVFDIPVNDVKLNMMSKKADWIVYKAGNDPYFYFSVDQYFRLIEKETVDVSMTFSMIQTQTNK